MHRRQLTQALIALACVGNRSASAQSAAPSADRFFALLRQGGFIVLMRHAQTDPGIGDPPNFRLGDCSTQRNLSPQGRVQATRIGQAFRDAGVVVDEVRSSAWCRCVDTAELAFGRHTVWAPINSFFQQDGRERQTAEALRSLRGFRGPGNLVLVTHQVNITALTGEYTAMGEILLAKIDPSGPAGLSVVARRSL